MKLNGLSLFANVGVAEAYLSSIGIDVVLANELDEKRARFYQHIYPKTEMICGDITDDYIRNEIIHKAQEAKVNFIIATPPCQGMSIAGKMNYLDPRNQLIYYAIDVINKVKPDFILLENVPRQLKTKIAVEDRILYIPDYIKEELGGEYRFNEETLIRAMDHGVPQMRKRNIFLLAKKEMKIVWEAPGKKEPVTLRQALQCVPSLDPELREGRELTLQKFPEYESKKAEGLAMSKWHAPPKHSWKMVEWLLHTPSGKTAFDNELYYPQKADGIRIRGHYNHYRRHDWDKPSRAITRNNGVMSSLACVHPGHLIQDDGTEEGRIYSDPRVFSVYELLIVSSLPLDWDIPDWADEKLIRTVIGEGIPPMLVKVIMEELLRNF
jgi:DNA (cytosine-5)-methyltransferase 1